MALAVRVLVALEPQMYREVLAFYLRQQRPHSEVLLASKQTLEAEARRTNPHLLIASKVPLMLKERGLYWVEVHTDGRLDADVRTNGDFTTIHNISLEDFLEVLDKAEEELAHAQ